MQRAQGSKPFPLAEPREFYEGEDHQRLRNELIRVAMVTSVTESLDSDEEAADELRALLGNGGSLALALEADPWKAGKQGNRSTKGAFSKSALSESKDDTKHAEFWERGAKSGRQEQTELAAAFEQIMATSRISGALTTDGAHSLRLWALSGLMHGVTVATNRFLSFTSGETNGVFGRTIQRLFDARFDWLKLQASLAAEFRAGREEGPIRASFIDARQRMLAAVYLLARLLFDASFVALMHVDSIVAPVRSNGSVKWEERRDGAWLADGVNAESVNAFFDATWPGLATVSTADRQTRSGRAVPTVLLSEEAVKRRAAEYMSVFDEASTLAEMTSALISAPECVSTVDRILRNVDSAALSAFVAIQVREEEGADATPEELAVSRAVQLHNSSFSSDVSIGDSTEFDSDEEEPSIQELDQESYDRLDEDTIEESVEFMANPEDRHVATASEKNLARRTASAAGQFFAFVNQDILARQTKELSSDAGGIYAYGENDPAPSRSLFQKVTGAVETNLLSHIVASSIATALLEHVIAPSGSWYATGFTLVASRLFRVASLETTASLITEQCTLDLEPGSDAYHRDYAHFRRWASDSGVEGTAVPQRYNAPGFYPLSSIREYVRLQLAQGSPYPSFASGFLSVEDDSALPNLTAAAITFFSGFLPETILRTGFAATDPSLAAHVGPSAVSAEAGAPSDNRNAKGPLSIFRASGFTREATLLHRLAREKGRRMGRFETTAGWELRTPAFGFLEHVYLVAGLLDDLYARHLRGIAGRYLSAAANRAEQRSKLSSVYATLNEALPFRLDEIADAAAEGLQLAFVGPFSEPLYLAGRGERYVVRALMGEESSPSPACFTGGAVPVSPADAAASPLAPAAGSIPESPGTASLFIPFEGASIIGGVPAVSVAGTSCGGPNFVVEMIGAGQSEEEEDLEISSVQTPTNRAAILVRRERRKRGLASAIFTENNRRLDPEGGSPTVETGVSTGTFSGLPLLSQSTAESFTRPRSRAVGTASGSFVAGAKRSYSPDFDVESASFHLEKLRPGSRLYRDSTVGTPFSAPPNSAVSRLEPLPKKGSQAPDENTSRSTNCYTRSVTVFEGATFVGRNVTAAAAAKKVLSDEEQSIARSRRMLGGAEQTSVLRSPYWAEQDSSTAAADAILSISDAGGRGKASLPYAPFVELPPGTPASTPEKSDSSPAWPRSPVGISPIDRAARPGTRLSSLLGEFEFTAGLGTPSTGAMTASPVRRGSSLAAAGPGSGSTSDLLAVADSFRGSRLFRGTPVTATPELSGGHGSRLFRGPTAQATRDAALCASPLPTSPKDSSSRMRKAASETIFACSTFSAFEANAKFFLDYLLEVNGEKFGREARKRRAFVEYAVEAWQIRAGAASAAASDTAAPLYGDVLRAHAEELARASVRWERMGARQEILRDKADGNLADFVAMVSDGELGVFMLSPSSLDVARASDAIANNTHGDFGVLEGSSAEASLEFSDDDSYGEEVSSGDTDFLSEDSDVFKLSAGSPAVGGTLGRSPSKYSAPRIARAERMARAKKSKAALAELRATNAYSDRHLAIMFLTNCGVLPPAIEAASDHGGARSEQAKRFVQDRIMSFSASEGDSEDSRGPYLSRFAPQGREVTAEDLFSPAERTFASEALAGSLTLAGLNLGARRRRRFNVSPLLSRSGPGGASAMPSTPAQRRSADSAARTSVIVPLTTPVMNAFGISDSDHHVSHGTRSASPGARRLGGLFGKEEAPRWAALRVPLNNFSPEVAAVLSPSDMARAVASGLVAEAALRQGGKRTEDDGEKLATAPMRPLVVPSSGSDFGASSSSGIFAFDEETHEFRRLSDIGELREAASKKSPSLHILAEARDGGGDIEADVGGRLVPLEVVAIDLRPMNYGMVNLEDDSFGTSQGSDIAFFDPVTQELRRLSLETEEARIERNRRGEAIFLDDDDTPSAFGPGVYTDAAGFIESSRAYSGSSSVSSESGLSEIFTITPVSPMATGGPLAGQTAVDTGVAKAIVARVDLTTTNWPSVDMTPRKDSLRRGQVEASDEPLVSQRYFSESRRTAGGQPMTPLSGARRSRGALSPAISSIWKASLAPLLLTSDITMEEPYRVDGGGIGISNKLSLSFAVRTPEAKALGIISLVRASRYSAEGIMRAGAIHRADSKRFRFFVADTSYFQALASTVQSAAAYGRFAYRRNDPRDANALFGINLVDAITARLELPTSALEEVAFAARTVFRPEDAAYYPHEAPNTEEFLKSRRHDDTHVPLRQPFCYFRFREPIDPLNYPGLTDILILPAAVYAPLLASARQLADVEFRFASTTRLAKTLRENRDIEEFLARQKAV